MIQKRIKNYTNNLAVARAINPGAVIYINSALKVLKSDVFDIDFKVEIDKIKKNLSGKAEKDIVSRARWKELSWLKQNIKEIESGR